MGLFGFGRKKGREVVLRADFLDLPQDEWTDDEFDHWMATCSDEEYWDHWESWSRATIPHPTITAVKRGVLDMALAAARSSHPQEFGAMLRVADGTIIELTLLPIVQGDAHTILYTHTLPVDRAIKGTLHSHPDTHPYPSDADFEFFESQGTVHLILCEPYGPDDWRAYDHAGQPVHLRVVA
ncbi:MAG: Mov34/MPN/PAD-1 family protein [Candidatus Thermoplasmatota archaeon]